MNVSIRRRIAAGIGANAYSQLITIVIQLASLPLFLSFWSVKEYGAWLLLIALPSYLSFMDGGILQTIAFRLLRLDPKSEFFQMEARRIVSLGTVVLVFGATAYLAITALTLALFKFPDEPNQTEKLAFIILSASAVVALTTGIPDAIIRGTNRYATATYLVNAARLTEWIFWVAGAWLVGSFTAAAALGLTIRLVFLVITARVASRAFGSVWVVERPTLQAIKQVMPASAANLAFPTAATILHNLVPITIGSTLGAAALVSFVAHRTASRFSFQIAGIPINGTGQEYALLLKSGDQQKTRRLVQMSIGLSVLISLLLSMLLAIFGEDVFSLWSGDKVQFDLYLVLLLACAAVCAAAWTPIKLLLQVYELHLSLANLQLLGAIIILFVAVVSLGEFNIRLIATLLAALEAATLAWAVHLLRRLLWT